MTATAGNSNWSAHSPYGVSVGGSPVSGTQATLFRDPLDAQRAGVGANNRVPGADYPDGYLSTIRSRRDDRALGALKVRLQDRSYQRGVHKMSKLPPQDYFWPPDYEPDLRLRARATVTPDQLIAVKRFAPVQTIQEQLLADSRVLPRGAEGLTEFRPNQDQRIAALQAQSPEWR